MDMLTIDEIKIAEKFTRKNLGEVRTGLGKSVVLTYNTCKAIIMPRGKTKTKPPYFLVRIESKEDRKLLMQYKSPQSICFAKGFRAVLNTAHKVASHIDAAHTLVKPLNNIFKVAFG